METVLVHVASLSAQLAPVLAREEIEYDMLAQEVVELGRVLTS